VRYAVAEGAHRVAAALVASVHWADWLDWAHRAADRGTPASVVERGVGQDNQDKGRVGTADLGQRESRDEAAATSKECGLTPL
jgi:hypothetical protein